MIRLALFQPEIPQNTATLIRTCACFTVSLDIIEPCGFLMTDKHFKRAGMDYVQIAMVKRHNSFEEFIDTLTPCNRLIATVSKGGEKYSNFTYSPDDIILSGSESTGLPESIINRCNHMVTIPTQEQTRSLNLAISSAIILSEAIRQISNSYN